MLQRIVIIGPESTGKSTLCASLAEHYNTIWVPEYAREHLEKYGTKYTYDDLLVIAQQQLALEDKMAANASNGLLFIDTNMYVMKVWCEFVFGKCHQWILDRIAERKYDFYLLCNTDLPWEQQPMREYPEPGPRLKLFHMYKDLLVHQQVPWQIISGTNNERVNSAKLAVDNYLKNKTIQEVF